jgi:hypothetical protein
MIISFAWTTPALLAGAKTRTRREWSPGHAAQFHAGDLVDAWNQTPRVNSARRGIAIARKVATIRLTADPHLRMSDITLPDDYQREGFDWFLRHGTDSDRARVALIWQDWHLEPHWLWVVEFELVDRVP